MKNEEINHMKMGLSTIQENNKWIEWIQNQKTWKLAIAFFVFASIFLFSSLNRALWEPDEPRQVLMTLEMAREGWVLFPKYRGNLYPDYPPFGYWSTLIVAGSLKMAGLKKPLSYPFVHRFSSSFFTLLSAFSIFVMALKLYGCPFTAFLGALILITSPMVFLQSQRAMIDPLLMGWISLFFLFFTYYLDKFQKVYFFPFFFLLGATWMTKGPVGVILISVIILFYFLWEQKYKETLKFFLFFGLSTLIIGSIWYGIAYHLYGERFFYEIFINQTLSRFLPKFILKALLSVFPASVQGMLRINPDHARPFWYYIVKFPALFSPWIFFAFIGAFYGCQKGNKQDRLPLVWFLVIFALFTISKNKRTYYLLPLFPGASLLASRGIIQACFQQSRKIKLYTKGVGMVLGSAIALAGLISPIFYFTALANSWGKIVHFLQPISVINVFFVGIMALGMGGFLFFLFWKERFLDGGTFLGILMVLLGGWLWMTMIPGINNEKDYRPIAEYVKKRVPKSRRVVFFHLFRDSFEVHFRKFSLEGSWKIEENGKIQKIFIPASNLDLTLFPEEYSTTLKYVKEKVPGPFLLVMSRIRWERFAREKVFFQEKQVGEKIVDNRLWKMFLVP